jgi:hypothetical protein
MPLNLRFRQLSAFALIVLLAACSTRPPSITNAEFMSSKPERMRFARAASKPIASERRIAPQTDPRVIDVVETTGFTSAPSAAAGRNFRLCLRGSPDCKLEELRDDERRSVAHAAKIKNYSACLSGNASCRPDGLDAEQREKVGIARDNRNATGCISGSSECRPGDLSETDGRKVSTTKGQAP